MRIPHSVKPAKTVGEQLDIFKYRGLVVEDDVSAQEILNRISYYRFTAYTLSLKTNDRFHDAVTFNQIYRLYDFDLKFRLLLMEIVEIVEVSMKTHISLVLAEKYDGMGYTDSRNFFDESKHEEFISELDKLLRRSKDIFVRHYIKKYAGEFPIWVAMEVVTFGVMSKLFKNLKQCDQDDLGNRFYFGVKGDFLASWLHAIGNLRNICAHYGRIYNRNFPIAPKLFTRDKSVVIDNYKVFVTVLNIKYLIHDKTYWNSWTERLNALMDEYTEVDKVLIGFPENWYDLLKK